jgi:transposase
MRVSTAFNRLLRLPGASVIDVSFSAEGVIVTVRLRRCRRVCGRCGQTGQHLEIHDRRVKRWRHLDLGSRLSGSSWNFGDDPHGLMVRR